MKTLRLLSLLFLLLTCSMLSAQQEILLEPPLDKYKVQDMMGWDDDKMMQFEELENNLSKKYTDLMLHNRRNSEPEAQQAYEAIQAFKEAELQRIIGHELEEYQTVQKELQLELSSNTHAQHLIQTRQVFAHLNLSDEQAEQLAFENKALEEVLNDEQLVIHRAHLKEEARSQTQKIELVLDFFEETQDHYTEDYLPDYLERRIEFEQKLNSADRAMVDELRLSYKKWTEAILQRNIGDNNGMNKEQFKRAVNLFTMIEEPGRSLMSNMHLNARLYSADSAFVEQLSRLVKKYEFDLDNYLSEENDQAFLDICEKNAQTHFASLHPNAMPPAELFLGIPFIFSPEIFILLDPTQSPKDSKDFTHEVNQHQVRLYPSPATTIQTIEFQLKRNERVLVELLDQKGQLVKTIQDGFLQSGLHKIEVNVQQLNGVMYYYRIMSNSGSSNLKGIVN